MTADDFYVFFRLVPVKRNITAYPPVFLAQMIHDLHQARHGRARITPYRDYIHIFVAEFRMPPACQRRIGNQGVYIYRDFRRIDLNTAGGDTFMQVCQRLSVIKSLKARHEHLQAIRNLAADCFKFRKASTVVRGFHLRKVLVENFFKPSFSIFRSKPAYREKIICLILVMITLEAAPALQIKQA